MRPDFATASDFAAWDKQAAVMTSGALLHSIKDCHEAAKAMRGWNPDREGFYMDQASTFGMELTRRRRAA